MSSDTTIADITARRRWLHGECHGCGRCRDIDPAKVTLPPLATLAAASALLRCRDCGQRLISLTAIDPPAGPERREAEILQHPAVQAVLTTFPDAQVTVRSKA